MIHNASDGAFALKRGLLEEHPFEQLVLLGVNALSMDYCTCA